MDERKTGRDARVDQVGFCNELESRYTKPLKDAIKSAMQSRQLDLAEADYFQGLLVSSETRSVDPAKFLRAFEKGDMTRAQFLSAITVKRACALEFMAPPALDKMCDEPQIVTQLRITRKKNVEVQLVDCVASLTAALQGQPTHAA